MKFSKLFKLLFAGWIIILSVDLSAQNNEFKQVSAENAEISVRESQRVFQIILDTLSTEDQTAKIQSQIDAIPDGAEGLPNIIQFPDICIWTEGDLANNPKGRNGIIRLENRHNLIIEGGTFYTKAPGIPFGGDVHNNNSSLRRHFWIIESSNITLRNIRVEGSNTVDGKLLGTSEEYTPEWWKLGETIWGNRPGFPAYVPYWEQEHAFDIRTSENITIQDCEIYGMWGDGVYVGADGHGVSKNIYLKNIEISWVGRQGVAAGNNVDGLLVDNVTLVKGRRSGIDLEPDTPSGYVRNVVIQNCVLETQLLPFPMTGKGDVSNIKILNNTYNGGNFTIAGDVLKKTRRKNYLIKGNIRIGSFGSPAASASFNMIDHIIFEENTDRIRKQSKNSISFRDCGGELIVKGNNFYQGENILDHGGNSEIIIKENKPEQRIKNF